MVGAFARSGLARRMHLFFTGESTPQLARCIEQHHLTTSIGFVGRVPENRLPSLYRGAEALIFPSLYEGFGLPILESMACGTPVVTANITAMPETAGDAALLVDPTSLDEIAEAMNRIVAEDVAAKSFATKDWFGLPHFLGRTPLRTSGEILMTRVELSSSNSYLATVGR